MISHARKCGKMKCQDNKRENMNNNTNKKNSLVVQAGILAAAGIIVRIIGLLYNTPLVKIIGDEGFGYYDSAYAAYSIVLLISSYSIPSAVSKIIAQRLAKREYRNAYRIFKCTLVYVVVVGLIASAFVYFCAGWLVKMESAVLPLKILAPTIFFSGILGAFRGFFQAQKSMVQTSISQIIEQIMNAIFSVWMAYVLVNAAAGKPDSVVASYGAAGSTIGTGVGVLSGLAFMLLIYFYNRKTILVKVANDPTENIISYRKITKLIFMVVTPFILSTGVYNINTFLDKTIYQWVLMDFKGVEESRVAFELSAFAKATKISTIPIAMASAMASTLIPRLSGLFATNDIDEAKAQVDKATKVTMFIAIPAAVGIGVLAKPVMRVIFPQAESLNMASTMLIILAITVVFYGLSTITQAVLQAIGKMSLPIFNALFAVIIHAGLMILFMDICPETSAIYIYGAATILYAFLLCLFNGIAVKKHLGYSQEWDRTFARPLISSIVMGAASYGVYAGIYALTGSNIFALFVAVIVGVFVYFVLCVKWKALNEEELRALPKGHLVVKAAKKLHLI